MFRQGTGSGKCELLLRNIHSLFSRGKAVLVQALRAKCVTFGADVPEKDIRRAPRLNEVKTTANVD